MIFSRPPAQKLGQNINIQFGDKELKVLIADGTMALVMGQGNVFVSGLQFKSVLYIPNLKCNLLSVSKLTKDIDCIVIFFPSRCIFQDQVSGKMIDSAEEKDGTLLGFNKQGSSYKSVTT